MEEHPATILESIEEFENNIICGSFSEEEEENDSFFEDTNTPEESFDTDSEKENPTDLELYGKNVNKWIMIAILGVFTN